MATKEIVYSVSLLQEGLSRFFRLVQLQRDDLVKESKAPRPLSD